MSLRTDFHLAFDEIAPSTGGLAERVVQTLLAEAPHLRRSQRWVFRLRAPMALVAVLVLIALVAGTLIRVGLVRDWRNWSTVHPPQINQTELKKLESNPWQLPPVAPTAACPVSGLTNTLDTGAGEPSMYGAGPVYGPMSEFSKEVTSWGTWHWTYFRVDTKASGTAGMLLIRARDLKTGEPVVFTRVAESNVFEGIPTGKVIGKDVLKSGDSVQRYSEVVLDLSVAVKSPQQWPKYTVVLGYSRAATGCVGYQVDGENFTETFVLDLSQVPTLYAS